MHQDNPATRRAAPGRRSRTRSLLTWLALLLAASLFAAACGGGDDDSGGGDAAPTTAAPDGTEAPTDGTDAPDGTTGDTGAPEEDFDPEGVIRVGAGMVYPAGVHLDPSRSAVNADRQWMDLVFGTLLRWTHDGRIVPWMAEDYEVVDPQTLTLTLREGVSFTDGTPYDAEAVRAGLLRTLDEASEVTLPSLSLAFQAISDIEVVDPLNLTITLNTPQAGELAAALADREGAIVSPKQAAEAPDDIDTKAVGAGPYVVEEFVDAQRAVFVKNPDFFDADSWKFARIEYTSVIDGASVVNGLLTDLIDLSIGVPPVDAERLRGDDRFAVESKPNDRSYIALNLCRAKPPLDDPDVRMAMNLAIDRQAISDLVFGGAADPASTLWPEGHVYYNPEAADVMAYDPDRAAELLGGETVELDIAIISVVPDHGTIAEVVQSQLNEVGFDVTIVPTQDPVSEWIDPQRAGALMVPGSRTGVDKYNRVFAEGQVQTLCGGAEPEIVDLLAPAAAQVPGDEDAAELFRQADLMIAEEALLVPLVWQPQLVVYNQEKLGGERLFNASQSQPLLDTFFVKN